jgi:orotidine-5'-phosphate decarboxylase
MTFHPTKAPPESAARAEGALPRGPRQSFGARFAGALAARGPLCAGIDPHASLLHEWGLPDDVSGLERFALTAVEGLAPYVAVVKPQSAFYERFGSRGIAVLERVLAESRAAGALVLLDVKRGDIGSTSQAYADAYLDPGSPLAADAITASPYLGFGSLDPMVDTARKYDAGLFVLALTSNKEGPEVQHARTDDGELVAGRMLDYLRQLNAGEEPLGSFGAVVGATIGDSELDFAFNGPILAPGFGAQGGTVADIRRIFGSAVAAVTPSSSRELLRKGPSVEAMRDEALRLNDELRALRR